MHEEWMTVTGTYSWLQFYSLYIPLGFECRFFKQISVLILQLCMVFLAFFFVKVLLNKHHTWFLVHLVMLK